MAQRRLMMSDSGRTRCELCRRDVPPGMITLHHLVPKARGGTAEQRVPMCRPCHKQVHATFGNAQLARHYASVESLRAAEPLQPFLRWIAKQDPRRNVRTARSRDYPRKSG